MNNCKIEIIDLIAQNCHSHNTKEQIFYHIALKKTTKKKY